MSEDFLYRPLGANASETAKSGRSFWPVLMVLALFLLGGAGILTWRHFNASQEPRGVLAVIKPAEPSPPQAKAATAAVSAPDPGTVAVFRPPGSLGSTGVFIKVPQDEQKPSGQDSSRLSGGHSK